LPQGSPASPEISNIVLFNLDKRLTALAKKLSLSYTRYADDITFSGNSNLHFIVKYVYSIIRDEGFQPNEKKLKIMRSSQRQIVTGLIVNKTIAVPKETIKAIENFIYYGKKYGIESVIRRFSGSPVSYERKNIYGLAFFIKMVNPEQGLKLIRSLDTLKWDYSNDI
jgi:RNA-directed DNA polymerase